MPTAQELQELELQEIIREKHIDEDLADLEKLLGDAPKHDEASGETVSPKLIFEDILEEIEDVDLWEYNEKIVKDDLFEFVDNPSYPTATEQMNMLDRLGSSRWYDKWAAGRAEQADEYNSFEVVEQASDFANSEAIAQTVEDAFTAVAVLNPPMLVHSYERQST